MDTKLMAGVVGQPLSIYVNGCDSPEPETDPSETAVIPSDCRTFSPTPLDATQMHGMRVQVHNLARRFRSNPVIAYRAQTAFQQLTNYWIETDPPVRETLRRLIRQTTRELAQVETDGGQYVHANHHRRAA